MTAGTLRISLRATALSLLGGATLFNTDVRAQFLGCNDGEECRDGGGGAYCAWDEPSTNDSHCDWSFWGTEFGCITEAGACDHS